MPPRVLAAFGLGMQWLGVRSALPAVSVSKPNTHAGSSSAEQPCETQQFWFERGPMKIFLVSVFLDNPSL